MSTAVIDCITNTVEHTWESVEYTERIDRTTVVLEDEYLNCGKTDLQYYEVEDKDEEK